MAGGRPALARAAAPPGRRAAHAARELRGDPAARSRPRRRRADPQRPAARRARRCRPRRSRAAARGAASLCPASASSDAASAATPCTSSPPARSRCSRPRTKVIRLGTGEFFGEMALILRRPRTADVVALSYCRLLMLRARCLPRLPAHASGADAAGPAQRPRSACAHCSRRRGARRGLSAMFHVKHRLTCRCRTWRRSGRGRPRRRPHR